ncbi:conserved hypothetical protein [Ricinus communis]|uniref:Uncharacterized protein n=1 Tax=Ricinus communis TaxID=3988 RepID=B9TD38_RICCO|nr:conserved hypothetical protein [Ricinus communis]
MAIQYIDGDHRHLVRHEPAEIGEFDIHDAAILAAARAAQNALGFEPIEHARDGAGVVAGFAGQIGGGRTVALLDHHQDAELRMRQIVGRQFLIDRGGQQRMAALEQIADALAELIVVFPIDAVGPLDLELEDVAVDRRFHGHDGTCARL